MLPILLAFRSFLSFTHFRSLKRVFCQLWGFIGTCIFIAFTLHPLFFVVGLLGTYPWILTDYLWPILRDILIGLIVVESLAVVFKFIGNAFLVIIKSSDYCTFTAVIHFLFISQTRDGHIIHQRLYSIYDVSTSFLSLSGLCWLLPSTRTVF